MTNQHPITPPQELVEQWAHMLEQHTDAEVFNRAARWGADQELEACCDVLKNWGSCLSPDLRAARRPKPPSLKELALSSLDEVIECLKVLTSNASVDGPAIATIRRALEQLDD